MKTTAIPKPQGNYVPAKRNGDLIFVSGMTPRKGGKLICTGSVSQGDALERCREAAELAVENAVQAASDQLRSGEILGSPLSLTVFINSRPEFEGHSIVADYASAHIEKLFGGEIPSRAAVGSSSLPGGATLEISLVVVVAQAARLTAVDQGGRHA
jgi:enamine deaminase RidA (YjgF/YER057c/UK114 family)